jgi:hypothetical protein
VRFIAAIRTIELRLVAMGITLVGLRDATDCSKTAFGRRSLVVAGARDRLAVNSAIRF